VVDSYAVHWACRDFQAKAHRACFTAGEEGLLSIQVDFQELSFSFKPGLPDTGLGLPPHRWSTLREGQQSRLN
jgi:hypothetical protein